MKQLRTPPPFPPRKLDGHKGDFGRVLVTGGSRGMAGAPCLAARAALRGGAGLVKAAVPDCVWDVAMLKLDECTTVGLPSHLGAFSKRAVEPWLEHLDEADIGVLGPGLSQHGEVLEFVRLALPQSKKPLVLDADGLNAFAGNLAGLGKAQKTRGAGLVLTPHAGEMARLLGRSAQAVQQNRNAAACEAARLSHTVVVLKGAGTLVTDGERLYQNKTGNPGMATGGTGDVLSGLIAALIGQHMDTFEAACLGVYLHGLAGDLAAKELSEPGMIAGDLLAYLPPAIKRYLR